MRGAYVSRRPNVAICLTAPENARDGGKAARSGSTRSYAAHAVRTLRPAGLTGGAMVRRAYTQRSLVEVLLPDADKLWDPTLRRIDALLDDEVLVDRIADALARRHPQSRRRGRLGTPAAVVLRLLVLKHLYDWSFDECEREVRGHLVYRAFCRIDGERVPDAKTLIRLAPLLDEAVLKEVLTRLVMLGRMQGLIRGRRLRVDTTVVETNIHYPTDSTLLADGVRVLTRTVLRDAEAVVRRLPARPRPRVQPLVAGLHATLAVVRQVLAQTRARVLRGDTHYPHTVVSVFEPHTEIIRKGKLAKPTEFGRLVKIQEAEAQFITDYAVCERRQSERALWAPALDRHIALFDRAPQLAVADGGFASRTNERAALDRGVRHVVLPRQSRETRSRLARAALRWRTGSEGRISALKRRHGLRRCRYRGESGMQRWVGFGVIANNLLVLGRAGP